MSTVIASASNIPEIKAAKVVAISQDPRLRLLRIEDSRSWKVGLFSTPKITINPLHCKDLKTLISERLTGSKQVLDKPFEEPRAIAGTSRLRMALGAQKTEVTPVPQADIIMVLMPQEDSTSLGYYNPAVGIYTPTVTTSGGISIQWTSMTTVGAYATAFCKVRVKVYRGADGQELNMLAVDVMTPARDREGREAMSMSLEAAADDIIKEMFRASPSWQSPRPPKWRFIPVWAKGQERWL